MKLAISNIAWNAEDNTKIAPILSQYNVTGLEVAPTKICEAPDRVSQAELQQFQNAWTGMELVAMQSLLFGKPHLSIFGEQQIATMTYLEAIIKMAGALKVKSLVFGSPKNRTIGSLDAVTASTLAERFFYQLGEVAAVHDVRICIEPNPVAYQCDFLTETLEALTFVKKVNHPAIQLQIDTGTMLINKEDPYEVISECLPFIGHFHISEPFLNLVGSTESHVLIAAALKQLNYQGWLSIEMKNKVMDNDVDAVKAALDFVAHTYFN